MTTWLTRAEAAAYLKVSLPTLDRMARDGRIKRHRFGSRGVRFLLEALDLYLLENKEDADKPNRVLTPLGWDLVLHELEDIAGRLGVRLCTEALALIDSCAHRNWLIGDRGVCAKCQVSSTLAEMLGQEADLACGHHIRSSVDWSELEKHVDLDCLH